MLLECLVAFRVKEDYMKRGKKPTDCIRALCCVLPCLCIFGCSDFGNGTTVSHPAVHRVSEDENAVLFLNDDRFVVTEYGVLSDAPSDRISGVYSLKGSYYGDGKHTAFLYTDPEHLPLEIGKTYRVSFNYRILETGSKGFEVSFYSPSAAKAGYNFAALYIGGDKGTEGTAHLNFTPEFFQDYQIKWTIGAAGAIAVDKISIAQTETKTLLVDLDIEASRSVIAVSRDSIRAKIENKPTVPIFCPWSTNHRADGADTAEHPYSLIWTSRGLNRNVEALKPVLPAAEMHRMHTDKRTLYLISADWCSYRPQERYLSQKSPFFLQEHFKALENSEYPETLMLNFEHREWAPLLAEKADNYKKAGFDGLMFDWWSNKAGNGRSKKKMQEVRLSILKEIRKKAGAAFILMGNVGWNTEDPCFSYLSGVFAELWKGKPGDSYVLTYEQEQTDQGIFSVQRLEDALLYWDSALQWPKVIAVEPWKITRGDYIADRKTEENLKAARLFAAMTCVIPENGYFLYADNNGDSSVSDHRHLYYDFYRTDFGKSISPMVRITEGAAYKEYERGFIAYNRTEVPVFFQGGDGRIFYVGAAEGAFVSK